MSDTRVPMTRALGLGALPAFVEEAAGHQALQRIFDRQRLPLSLIEHRETRLPLVAMQRVFEDAARESGDRTLGLRVGDQMTHKGYGLWSRYLAAAPTLDVAIRRAIQTLWMYQSGSSMSLTRHGKHAVWHYRPAGLAGRDAALHADHVLPTMLTLARLYLGPAWAPDWCELNYPRDPDAGAVETWLDRDVVFGAPGVGVAIGLGDLATKHPEAANGELLPTRREVAAALAPSRRDDLLGPVMDVITLRLLDGQTDLDGAALLLGRGPRSLQGDLSRAGTSYRALLDQARLRRGAALLQESEISVTQIAIDLGYLEPTNFTRAFRRWSGQTPSGFRTGAGLGGCGLAHTLQRGG